MRTRVGGIQSDIDIRGCCVFLRKGNKMQKREWEEIIETTTTKNNIWISNCQSGSKPCSFPDKENKSISYRVLIQLKINTGNEAALLSKRAVSSPLSLYVAGTGLCWLCCQDAAQTLESFLAETLAGLCIVPLSFLRQSVSAKDENYSWLDRNLEQQLFLDDHLRERRWIGVVVREPWCACCMQPIVKDIKIIVDG